LADSLFFLHKHGIVHRDVKDENVVLGPDGKCILIDFGSSGLIKNNGWDTFSGTLDYAGPEILRGERYRGKEQDVWAFGVVAYVLLIGECPFQTAAEAQEGLKSPFANASISLDERCGDDKEKDGEEDDGGGALGDAAELVRACLEVEVDARPTFESILQCRFLSGHDGWGMENPHGNRLKITPQPSAFPAHVI
jgi:serine/threonine protein kinase